MQDERDKGEDEMTQVLKRIRTADIPEDIRKWAIAESKKRKVSPEVMAAAIESLMKYRNVYKELAKR
ncbi:MAG: hypothetical protein FWJ65_13320 [Limnochordales bacterium]